jgi:hypothetical protein
MSKKDEKDVIGRSFLWEFETRSEKYFAACGLPPFYVPVVMRVYHTYSPCLEEGGAWRSLAQDTSSQTLPGPYNPSCCAADSDYNPSANDRQHISIHQYTETIPCSITHPLTYC